MPIMPCKCVPVSIGLVLRVLRHGGDGSGSKVSSRFILESTFTSPKVNVLWWFFYFIWFPSVHCRKNLGGFLVASSPNETETKLIYVKG